MIKSNGFDPTKFEFNECKNQHSPDDWDDATRNSLFPLES